LVIRFENLSKTFGRGDKCVHAVRDISLEIEAGQVYGFLGPNGAGKTTTIRMMMGLIRPTQGSVFVFGQDVNRHPEVLRRVGAVVETPSFYSYMNGRDNLEVLARTAGDYSPKRVLDLLDQVGLSRQVRQVVKGYSMGMKQRLGIAAALLNDPDLVVFDEPTNGLDPAGIQEMRDFIRDLVEQHGKTVFLSSHLLGEVEQVCDRISIINLGEIISQGRMSELLSGEAAYLHVQATPKDRAAEILGAHWKTSQDGSWLVVNAEADEGPELVRRLVSADVDVHQVIARKQSLEKYFMEAVNNHAGEKNEAEADHA
jgi:ABC-2 type transport system ATP-binding protein